MSIKTRSKSKKESEMTATEGKFDAVLTKMDAKMDDLLKAKADQEVKLNSILQKLENLKVSQKKTAATLLRKHSTWSWPNLRKK